MSATRSRTSGATSEKRLPQWGIHLNRSVSNVRALQQSITTISVERYHSVVVVSYTCDLYVRDLSVIINEVDDQVIK